MYDGAMFVMGYTLFGLNTATSCSTSPLQSGGAPNRWSTFSMAGLTMSSYAAPTDWTITGRSSSRPREKISPNGTPASTKYSAMRTYASATALATDFPISSALSRCSAASEDPRLTTTNVAVTTSSSVQGTPDANGAITLPLSRLVSPSALASGIVWVSTWFAFAYQTIVIQSLSLWWVSLRLFNTTMLSKLSVALPMGCSSVNW